MKTSSLMLCVFLTACQSPTVTSTNEVLADNAELFQHILTRTNHNPNESLTPGISLDIYMVRLDELSQYDGKTPFAPLLHDTSQRFVSLHGEKGEPYTSMTMIKSSTGWTLARAGSENLTRQLVKAHTRLSPDHTDTALVRIPALHLDLLVSHHGSETLLTPITDNTNLSVVEGASESAARLLARLSPAAQQALSQPSY
jgi:hypothetical protein